MLELFLVVLAAYLARDLVVKLFMPRHTKKNHLSRRLQGAIAAYWDLEFQREKTKAIREGYRREFDKVTESHATKKFFRDLVEAYGLDVATKIQKGGMEVSVNALREGEEAETAKKIGLESLRRLKPEELSKEDKETLENLNKQLEPLEREVEQMKSQMNALDGEISGVGGYEEKLTATIELQKMIKEELRKL